MVRAREGDRGGRRGGRAREHGRETESKARSELACPLSALTGAPAPGPTTSRSQDPQTSIRREGLDGFQVCRNPSTHIKPSIQKSISTQRSSSNKTLRRDGLDPFPVPAPEMRRALKSRISAGNCAGKGRFWQRSVGKGGEREGERERGRKGERERSVVPYPLARGSCRPPTPPQPGTPPYIALYVLKYVSENLDGSKHQAQYRVHCIRC